MIIDRLPAEKQGEQSGGYLFLKMLPAVSAVKSASAISAFGAFLGIRLNNRAEGNQLAVENSVQLRNKGIAFPDAVSHR